MATPQTIDDFRRNTDRQSREQKSFGNVLATVTYSILVAFILVTGLASYGGYVLFEKIRLQGQSIVDIDNRYSAEVVGLKEDLSRSHAEMQRIGDEVTRQQDQIDHLRVALDKANTDLATRTRDLAALKTEVDLLRGGPIR